MAHTTNLSHQEEPPRKRIKLIASIPSYSPLYDAHRKFISPKEFEVDRVSQTEPGRARLQRERSDSITAVVRSRWCDLLLVVADATVIHRILSGYTETDLHAILRAWDPLKPVLLVPEMSVHEWRNPLTKRQIHKLRARMPWMMVLDPILWDLPEQPGSNLSWAEMYWDWPARDSTIKTILQVANSRLEADASGKVHPLGKSFGKLPSPQFYSRNSLPPEILTMVFEFIGDWELAQTVGIYTNLLPPAEWVPHLPTADKPGSLEYTILTSPFSEIRNAFSSTKPKTLSDLATKLVFKFSMTQLLTYLSVEQKDIFWTSFGLALLPHRASVQFNKPAILDWWLKSPAIIKKDYGPEAMDGASRMGFVPVLDWWLNSGLPLLYTERALEAASARGHIEVLEWWKRAAEIRSKTDHPIKLKVGKSVVGAAQSGRASALEWWDKSGIAYGHEDGVARLASAHGHVDALQKWYDLKDGKIVFDNQVLVGATKNGHANVLEWWKQSGLRVEYKTCDIEEAMEDSTVGGDLEEKVRLWWERNGLNLGVGTNEWMKVKCLTSE